MSRAGRKRKARRASGVTPKRDRPPSPRAVARAMPHRRIVGDDAVHDPRCETPIGCLNVIGAIADREYSAAMRLQGVVQRYRQAIDAPGPPGSIAGTGLPQARAGFEISPEDYSERLQVYREAKRHIESTCGLAAWSPVMAIAVDGQPVPAGGFHGLMLALRALSAYFEGRDQAEKSIRP